jgi:hypothetical protein
VRERGEPSPGIEPLDRLVTPVMEHAPYRSAERGFWVVDNGASPRGQAAVQRVLQAYPQALLVHTPLQASGLNQGESTFRWGHERSCPPMLLPAGRKGNHGCGSTRTCGTHDYALARGTSRGKNCSSFSTALKPGKWLSARPSQLRRHQGKWPELGPSNPTGICETDHLASPRPRFTPRFWPSDDGRRPVPRL